MAVDDNCNNRWVSQSLAATCFTRQRFSGCLLRVTRCQQGSANTCQKLHDELETYKTMTLPDYYDKIPTETSLTAMSNGHLSAATAAKDNDVNFSHADESMTVILDLLSTSA